MTEDALPRPAVSAAEGDEPAAEGAMAAASEATTPAASEAITPEAATDTVAAAVASETLSTADISAMAEAHSVANVLATAGIAVVPEAAATDILAEDAEDPAAAAAAAAAAKVERNKKRRATLTSVFRTLGIVAATVILFVGGIAIGNRAFWNSHPTAGSGGQISVGQPMDTPAPVASEFISALAANDADALRSSLEQVPHLDLTDEMSKFGIQHIDKVEVLGTKDFGGNRSATEILMKYQSTDGVPFAINLVILVDGGKIEGFR